MTRLSRSTARRRAVAVLAVGATALGGTALLGPGTGSASSHREAPYIQGDPAVDNTDTYAFISPDNANMVTVIANFWPLEEPTAGPNFFPWETDAGYDINIDNNGDAKPDLTYRWVFDDVDRRGRAERGIADGTFLYNDGPITSLTDPNLLFRQTYDLKLIRTAADGTQTTTTVVDNGLVAPSHVGDASLPDGYAPLRQAAVTALPGGGNSYVGQAEDPFFLDLRIFDLLYGGDFSEVGNDTLEGYNVNTIALQLPKTAVAGGNDPMGNPVVGIWSTALRKQNRSFLPENAAPQTNVSNSDDAARETGRLVQVSRLGMPLVNEAVVPANLKDFFNRSTPDTDAKFLAKVQHPEVPVLVEKIYGVPNPEGTPQGKDRPDLVAVFLTGLDGLNATKMNANNPNPAPAEYLRLNLTIPGKAQADQNRLGVIGGDNAGYPNGRRLGDDVVDITLRVAEGLLVPDQDPEVKKAIAELSDGVDSNDKRFLDVFPYVADPYSGSDSVNESDQG